MQKERLVLIFLHSCCRKGYRPSRAFQFVGVASQLGMSNTPQYHRLQVSVDGNVVIENCSNTVNQNEYISFGFSFKAT